MAHCKSVLRSSAKKILLVCSLDEGHDLVHPKHYDSTVMATWNKVSNNPTPVASTRTSKSSVAKSAAIHTGRFDVVPS